MICRYQIIFYNINFLFQKRSNQLLCLVKLKLTVDPHLYVCVVLCRLGAMNRELKLKEMQLLDSTRRKFISYQQQQKEAELARLDDELRSKVQIELAGLADIPYHRMGRDSSVVREQD